MFVMTTKLIFMGTPAFSVPALSALLGAKYDVVAVYTQPDRQVGRGQRLAFSAVKEYALTKGLNILQPQTLKTAEAAEQIKKFKADIAIVAAYGKIIPENILQIPRLGFLNIHPSLLPRHRGATPIPSSILSGDKVTGVSIMLLDAGMDSGPVFKQSEINILDEDTTGTLTEKLSHLGADMLAEVLPLWLDGKIKPQSQDNSTATYTDVLTKEDGRIDWHADAVDIWRRVRAFQPWPGCFTTWGGKNLKILQALPISGDNQVETGRIVSVSTPSGISVRVGCGRGLVELVRLQLEGKNEMLVQEFVRGRRDFIGGLLL